MPPPWPCRNSCASEAALVGHHHAIGVCVRTGDSTRIAFSKSAMADLHAFMILPPPDSQTFIFKGKRLSINDHSSLSIGGVRHGMH